MHKVLYRSLPLSPWLSEYVNSHLHICDANTFGDFAGLAICSVLDFAIQFIEHEFLLLFNTGLVWDIPCWLALNFRHLKILFELLQTAVSPGNSRAVICLFPHLKMQITKENYYN